MLIADVARSRELASGILRIGPPLDSSPVVTFVDRQRRSRGLDAAGPDHSRSACGRWCLCRRCCDLARERSADSIVDFNYQLDVLGRRTVSSRPRSPDRATRRPRSRRRAPMHARQSSPAARARRAPARRDARPRRRRRRSRFVLAYVTGAPRSGRCRSRRPVLGAYLRAVGVGPARAGRAGREGALHAAHAARAELALRRSRVRRSPRVDRAAEIAALGARARDAFEEKHRAREVTIARVAPGDPSVRGVDPRDAPRRVRRGRDVGARSARSRRRGRRRARRPSRRAHERSAARRQEGARRGVAARSRWCATIRCPTPERSRHRHRAVLQRARRSGERAAPPAARPAARRRARRAPRS